MSKKSDKEKAKQKAQEVAHEVKASAHKVWLAGLGALAVAEEEGSKFFKRLVDKGEVFEERGKERFGKMRESLEGGVQDVRAEAESLWERLSGSFDDKVAEALHRLGVPGREEIHKLTRRVEELTRKVDELKPRRTASARKTTKKATTKTAQAS
ncbi:MAG: phasin family protein [Thermoanaerobaculia bacterium]